LRRDVNARLDALDAQVRGLLPHHPVVPPEPATVEQPAPEPPTAAAQPQPTAAKQVRVGEQVYVPRLGGTYAVVEAAPDGRSFKVQAGNVRVKVRADELWTLDEEREAQPSVRQGISRPELSAAIPEIDLHGYTEQEALVTLELFLHHAFTTRTPRVRVIHGKGDGILRAAVRRELACNPMVRAIDIGPHFKGDDGVTLAELDL
jgi:DNA mismatch repair protein MutS2